LETKRPHLLALDGDEAVLRQIAQIAGPFFETLTTRDPRRLLGWASTFAAHTAAVVTEHVLETAMGVALLEQIRSMCPGARRVLMTTYHDLTSIVDGIHSGVIDCVVPKPCSPAELLGAVMPVRLRASA